MYKYFLFDLDGTLTKSEKGIFNCIRYALDWAKLPYPDEAVLRSFIGPSLYDSFTRVYGMDDTQAKSMVEKYRERYNDVGLFENEVYEGIPETLAALAERGCTLAVATSKPTEPTLRILERFDIAKYFSAVVGINPDKMDSDKRYIISEVLRRLRSECGMTDADISRRVVAMVGDRYYDIEGGKACGIDTVGVLYGYGGLKELDSAGPAHMVNAPCELLGLR